MAPGSELDLGARRVRRVRSGINAFSIATEILPGGLFVQSAELSFPANAQTPIAADVTFFSPEADGPLTASLDWRRSEGEEWTITVRTADGAKVRLEDGGSQLLLNGEVRADTGAGEYPDIYRQFGDLIDKRRSLVDVRRCGLSLTVCLRRPATVEAVHI